MKPKPLSEKEAALMKLLNEPRFLKMLDNARETREKIAADVLKRYSAASHAEGEKNDSR